MNENYKTITEINQYIKTILDNDSLLNCVYIKGEISNFKNHSRGHLYFTLKDDETRISAVMFYNNALKLNFKPEDGMNVLIKGRISSYPAQGSYQIYVETMDLDGVGNLYVEFEKLKEKLLKEGLFSQEHKKILPKYPKKIGIVTAPTGAAVRDIISTIKRRFPICETILFPSLVQGKDAAPDLVRQIKKADEYNLDLLIVGRGGGSIEDLWAFNEEIVARAIYEAKTPIISAVGHEPDFTIADFVADLRAPTPTGAAEMAVPTMLEIKTLINQYILRANKNIKNIVNRKFILYKNLENRRILKNPLMLYELKEQRLDKLMDLLNRNIIKILDLKKYNLNINFNKIKSPKNLLEIKNKELKENINLAKINILKLMDLKKHKYDFYVQTLKLVNPLNILSNGYSLTIKDNKIIKSIKDININEEVTIKLSDGEFISKVKEINNGN